MSSDDSFEDRLRAIADQIARSLSDNDINDLAQRFGVDAERVRGFASNIESWLGEGLFDRVAWSSERPEFRGAPPHTAATGTFGSGPHPLDLPTPEQGIALSALDSGRFTVRPGSNLLSATGADPDQSVGGAADLVNELRAHDWITADGSVTLMGRQALLRWSKTVDSSADRPQP